MDLADLVILLLSACTADQINKIKIALEKICFSLRVGRYCTGKIYKIVLKGSAESTSIAYIGSTIRPLPYRWSGHKSFFKKCPADDWAQYVLELGGADNFEIQLIEEYPCSSLEELLSRERYYIELLDPVCNKNMRRYDLNTQENNWERLTSKLCELTLFSTQTSDSRLPYLDIPVITSAEANIISVLQNKNRATYSEVLSYERFLFDSKIALTETPERLSGIFDAVVEDPAKRRTLDNLYSFSRMKCLLQAGLGNTVAEQFPPVVIKVGDICCLLGLQNPVDETSIPEALLKANAAKLESLITELQTLLKIRDRTKAKSVSQAIRNKLSGIFKEFADCKLETLKNVQTKTGRVYTYQVEASEFAKTVWKVL